jgi:type II secretory pathway component PulF
MPTFRYKARSPKGEAVEGTLDANDRRAAAAAVEKLGLVPVSIAEGATPTPAHKAAVHQFRLHLNLGRKRMSGRELLTFTTELSDLLASGMNLGMALSALAKRSSGRAGDEIVRALRDDIVRGTSLSDAVAKHPATFSNLFVSMIRVGEASGTLAEVLNRLVEHYERIQEVKEKVVMALVYPAIVLTLGIATLVFSMVFVIPKFSMIFEELGSTLPLPTRMLIGTSKWLVRYGWALVIGLVIGGILLNRYVQTPTGRRRWHAFQLRIPLIRGIIAASTYANFARTLSTLLSNGVPALQALAIVEQTVGNVIIASEIRNARERVTDGHTISGPLAAGGVFPPLMTDMLAIGEQTGDLPGALNHIAKRYENELNRSVKIFTTALEPILIVIVAVLVGFVAVSILMAVFNLTSGLNV